jgi:hypothetical protein
MASICFLFCYSSSAQSPDSAASKKNFKNTIKFNVSSTVIFGSGYLVFSYERLVNKNQSFSIDLGTYGLPNLISASDSISLSGQSKNKGFHVAADYRFYILSENKYAPPRGLYFGPYYSYNQLSRQNAWQFNTSNYMGNANAGLDVHINTFGVEMGYQVVLWERLAVDLIAVGPGIAEYSIKTNIQTDLSSEKRNELLGVIANSLKQILPGSNDYLNSTKYREASGISTWAIGYRYIVQVGFRF